MWSEKGVDFPLRIAPLGKALLRATDFFAIEFPSPMLFAMFLTKG